MIDFQKSAVFKLSPISVEKTFPPMAKFLIEVENIVSAFQTVRDQLVFTNKRIIAANVQGLTGTKVWPAPPRCQCQSRVCGFLCSCPATAHLGPLDTTASYVSRIY